jgi:hypothetical protein
MVRHRGQLTVYLRLNEEKVPAIYGHQPTKAKSRPAGRLQENSASRECPHVLPAAEALQE